MNQPQEFNYVKTLKKLINNEKREAVRGLLRELDQVEIANSVLRSKLKHQLAVVEALTPVRCAEVFKVLQNHQSLLQALMEQMPNERLVEVFSEMDWDDATNILSRLEDERRDSILEALPKQDREEIMTLLGYAEDSAGGLMNPDVLSAFRDMTVREAIENIRSQREDEDLEHFYKIYVIDEHDHLIGAVDVQQMLVAQPETFIHALMDPNVVSVEVGASEDEVVRLAREYDLVTIPVIDRHLRLKGRITIDDLVDVMEERYREGMGHVAGTSEEEVMEPSVFRISRDRLPWLLIGMLGGLMAALVISGYETTIAQLPEVAYFMPLIAAIGGNISIQSSSIVVRGLATGEISTADLYIRLWKEIRVSLLNGGVCAFLLMIMAYVITQDLRMSLAAGLALSVVVMIATVVGSSVPIVLKNFNIDPALATGPFITTANDILGIVVYLFITVSLWAEGASLLAMF